MIIASIVIPKVVMNPHRAVSETDFEDGFLLSSKQASKHGRRHFKGFNWSAFLKIEPNSEKQHVKLRL